MPVRKVYRDTAEDEYIFDCLKNKVTQHQKERLTPEELRIFKNDQTLRRFVNGASSTQRDLLMAKLGFAFAKIWMQTSDKKEFSLKKLNKQISGKSQQEMIDIIKGKNIFAVSSREVLSLAFLISQNTHSPYYFLNQDYQRIFDSITEVHLKNLNKLKGEPLTDLIKSTYKSRRILAAFAIELRSNENFIRGHLQVDSMIIDILLYLFLYEHSFIELKTIVKYLHHYPDRSIAVKLATMARQGMIDRKVVKFDNMRSKVYGYTLAEDGMYIVCKYLEVLSAKTMNE